MDSIFSDYKLPEKLNISTNCLVCGESVPMLYNGDYPKICDRCKNVILENRNHIIHIPLRDEDINRLKDGEDVELNNIEIGSGRYATIIIESPWTSF